MKSWTLHKIQKIERLQEVSEIWTTKFDRKKAKRLLIGQCVEKFDLLYGQDFVFFNKCPACNEKKHTQCWTWDILILTFDKIVD